MESSGWVTSPIKALFLLNRALCRSEKNTKWTLLVSPIGLSSGHFETVASAVQCGADVCSCGSFVSVFRLCELVGLPRFGRVLSGYITVLAT